MRRIILGTMLVAVILLTVLFLGCTTQGPIGGQRDEYGCLGPAGYSYDEDLGICARNWEITGETQVQAIRTATAYIKQARTDTNSLTYVDIAVDDCDGCFTLYYDLLGEQIQVEIKDWKVVD